MVREDVFLKCRRCCTDWLRRGFGLSTQGCTLRPHYGVTQRNVDPSNENWCAGDGDVMVPTGIAGVRQRDIHFGHNPMAEGFENVDADQRRELVHGSVVARYGARNKLGISDRDVPVEQVHATQYKSEGVSTLLSPFFSARNAEKTDPN